MPALWAQVTLQTEELRWVAFGVGVTAALTAIALMLWRAFHPQLSASELERRRRGMLYNSGKIGDGEILDVDGVVILYTYSVGGVEYTVGQDASALESALPEDRMRMVGPASVRFDPKNPPNSIVLCEQWSGLRLRDVSDRLG